MPVFLPGKGLQRGIRGKHGQNESASGRESPDSPAETIVFENSLYALLTAKNAGFATAAVKDTAEHMQEELAKAADFYCERLSELLLRDDFLAAVNGEE